MAHLDVKPDHIYVKNGIYKLGDFGCATLFDRHFPIEEGDARYMPREILNEKYDNLDKVDIYSLGVSIYELIQGSSCMHFMNLKEGKVPLLPTHSMQLQKLLREMLLSDIGLSPRNSATIMLSAQGLKVELEVTGESLCGLEPLMHRMVKY